MLRASDVHSRTPSGRRTGPVTDYTLARRAVIAQCRRGVLNLLDVCDAHPELLRAGRNIGRSVERECPICSRDTLRVVRYVFGEQLGRLSGRPVYPEDWVDELVQQYEEFRCYAVEVCIDCSWNHLLASYLLGRRYSAPRRRTASTRR
ncbi:MAG: DUF5318 family protein [Actinomycetota bacterium]